MTGARASAMCLCVNGLIAQNKAYSIGNTTISCDIGGSSTDIAISRVWGPAVLKRFCQLELKPSGFTTVQRAFFLHVAQTLTRAGAHRPNDLAPKLVCDEGTVKILHGFTDKQHKDRVKLKLPSFCTVKSWPPSPQAGSKKTRIEGLMIYIYKQVFLCIPPSLVVLLMR